jgi:hypothetical protein
MNKTSEFPLLLEGKGVRGMGSDRCRCNKKKLILAPSGGAGLMLSGAKRRDLVQTGILLGNGE